MTRQLATMVNSGMTILRALYVLEAQTENEKLADDDQRGPQGRRGRPAAVGLAGAPPQGLQPALRRDDPRRRDGRRPRLGRSIRVADQLESADSLRRQVKAAMAYPLVVMGFAVSVLIALVVFLVPVFVGVFKQFGGDLPTITKFTVGMSQRRHRLLVGAHRSAASASRGRSASGRPPTRGRIWDTFKLRIPMKIGDIVQKIALARWSRTLCALVSAGVPLLQALEITGQTAGNCVRREGDGRRHRVASSQGGTIADPLKARAGLPGHGQRT